MSFPHWINFYQRPLQGGAFFKRYIGYGYKHSIVAAGGFDTMSCQIAVSRSEAEQFFERLGYEVSVYIDNPARRAWHGFLNRVTATLGNTVVTSSLDEMSNRVTVVYSASDVSATATTTTTDNVTASQAVYGIKEGFLDGYAIRGTALGKFDDLRSTVLNTHAWPQQSTAYNSAGGGANSLLQIECLGLYHTLQWEKYLVTAGAAANADAILSAQLPNFQTLYFDPSVTRYIVANSAFTQNPQNNMGNTYWEFFQSIQEAGDGSNRWIMGVSAPEDTGGAPYFYYRASNTDIEYIIRRKDPKVRNVYGQYINPWDIRPDRGCRVADILTGWNGIADDPATFYIETVEYDAETQSVVFGSGDDISLNGVFNLRHYFNRYGKRFGVTRRQTRSA